MDLTPAAVGKQFMRMAVQMEMLELQLEAMRKEVERLNSLIPKGKDQVEDK